MKTLYGNKLSGELKRLSEECKKRIWICCPFIGNEKFVRALLGNNLFNKKIDRKIITDNHEISSVNFSIFQHLSKDAEIRSLAGVHAKIYIIDNDCLITSANLTETAFTKRHEIGVLLLDNEALETIEIFNSWWKKATKIKHFTLPKTEKQNGVRDEVYGFSLPKIWNNPDTINENRYWLKPIGVTESPITEDRIFNKQNLDLHFAVPPNAVRSNDILIAYGIGAKRILGVYKATTNGIEMTEEEREVEEWTKRWPYYVESENLTPNFGQNWMKHNLYANDLVAEFLRDHKGKHITFNGGDTLGALNYRKDKIRLTNEFAEFIISKINVHE